jgi:hypothetical protein
MFMRIFSVLLALALVGCRSEPSTANKVEQAKAADRIDCAIGAAADFSDGCAIERTDGTSLILRHKDGGFRRLTLETDGTIDTADGAETLTVRTLGDGRSEIAVGTDRYRLPSNL